MSAKTSAYVFPFRPFRNLERTEPKITLADRQTVDRSFLEPLLETIAPRLELPQGGNLDERIVALFASDAVRFGAREWITDLAADWSAQARHFIEKGEPILFTILGFPFKAPVILKTDRILADFGELAMLKCLHEIGSAIACEYEPGVKIHVFAEGAFAPINGMPQADSDAYFDSLVSMCRNWGFDAFIVLHETNAIAEETPGFKAVWDETTDEIKARRDSGDEKTRTALTDSFPVTFHLNANPGVEADPLRRAYLDDPSAKALRDELVERSEDGVVRYRAFLEARDKVQLLELFAPKALAMTVSPRPGRLGVRPLPEPADVLPYHGLPIWDAESRALLIDYRWDFFCEDVQATPVYWDEDGEDKPFLYLSPGYASHLGARLRDQ